MVVKYDWYKFIATRMKHSPAVRRCAFRGPVRMASQRHDRIPKVPITHVTMRPPSNPNRSTHAYSHEYTSGSIGAWVKAKSR